MVCVPKPCLWTLLLRDSQVPCILCLIGSRTISSKLEPWLATGAHITTGVVRLHRACRMECPVSTWGRPSWCCFFLNRVEEEALKSLTGVHRVTKPGDKTLNTTDRVLAHSAQVVRAGDWNPLRTPDSPVAPPPLTHTPWPALHPPVAVTLLGDLSLAGPIGVQEHLPCRPNSREAGPCARGPTCGCTRAQAGGGSARGDDVRCRCERCGCVNDGHLTRWCGSFLMPARCCRARTLSRRRISRRWRKRRLSDTRTTSIQQRRVGV